MNPETILGNLGGPLNDLMKRLERHLIKTYVAKQIATTSRTNKSQTKHTKETSVQQLIQQSNQFESDFSSTTKGQWVDSALEAFSENKNKLQDL